MHRDSYTVWLVTHKMFVHREDEEVPEPIAFHDIDGDTKMYGFFSTGKSLKLIDLLV